MSKLHDDVAKVAGTKGAMVLDGALIERILLTELRRSAAGFKDVEMATGHPDVLAVFDSLSVNPEDLVVGNWVKVDDVTLTADVTPEIEFIVRLAFSGNPSLTFGRAKYRVKALVAKMQGDVTGVNFSFSFDEVSFAFNAFADERTAAIDASKIFEEDLLRVEGAFTYAMGERLLRSALGVPRGVNLNKLFPAVSFSGKLELHLTDKSIVVVPDSMGILAAAGCSPSDPLAGAGIKISTPDSTGKFSVSGSVRPPGRPSLQADPVVALYAPKPLLDQRFSSAAAPGFTHEDIGNGFIGHVLHVTAAIRGVSVSVESGALELTLRLAIWGSASVNVDVPCLGRKEFGRLDVRLPDSGEATLTVTLRGALDSSLRALLTSELKGLNLGTPSVNFSLFGGLKASLIATVTSYITDYIIGIVIRNNLPWMVFDAIRGALDDKFFVLADLGQLISNFKQVPNFTTHSGVVDSALMGVAYKATD